MRVWLVVAAAILAPAAHAANGSGTAVDRWIAEHAGRLGGAETRALRAAVTGDLDGDGRADLAVLYTIEGARPGGRSLRYLAAFRDTPAGLELSAHALVGGRGIREVNRATILKRVIELETLEYGPLDAACCPKVPARVRYRLTERRLTRLGAAPAAR